MDVAPYEETRLVEVAPAPGFHQSSLAGRIDNVRVRTRALAAAEIDARRARDRGAIQSWRGGWASTVPIRSQMTPDRQQISGSTRVSSTIRGFSAELQR